MVTGRGAVRDMHLSHVPQTVSFGFWENRFCGREATNYSGRPVFLTTLSAPPYLSVWAGGNEITATIRCGSGRWRYHDRSNYTATVRSTSHQQINIYGG
jgi:hypothetical protein